MNKRAAIRIVSILILATAILPASAYESGDSQLWMTFAASGKFTNDISLYVYEQFRLGDDAGEYYYSETSFLLSWNAEKWLTLGAGFTESQTKSGKTLYDAKGNAVLDEYWLYEHQPEVEATFKGKVVDWKVEDRVRVEYRMKEDTQDYFRYRNRIRLISPWKWTSLSINPRAYYEVNLSDMPSDVNWVFDRQRLYVGISLSLLDHLTGELYYLKQYDWTSGDWREYNVFGVGLTASF